MASIFGRIPRTARTSIRTTGNSAFLRGIHGEILTLRQLTRTCGDQLKTPSARLDYRGYSEADYDILLAIGGKEIRVDAKEKSEGDRWVRAHARDYAEVRTNKKTGLQRIRPRTDVRDALFFVFVDSVGFPETGGAKFYLLSDHEAKDTSPTYTGGRVPHTGISAGAATWTQTVSGST